MRFEKVHSPDGNGGIPLFREVNGNHPGPGPGPVPPQPRPQGREDEAPGERSLLLLIDPVNVRRARFRAEVVSCVVTVAAVFMGILIGWLLRGGM